MKNVNVQTKTAREIKIPNRIFLSAYLCAAVSVVACCAVADAVGFREAGGVHVASGSQTLSGGLVVSPQGEFVTTGAGTLVVPMDGIENGAPYTLVVAGGKLSLTGAQGTPSATPPAFVTDKATFWVDASEMTDGDTVSTWSDKRTGGEWSAEVRYRNAPEETPPVVMTTNGVRGVYFGGQSGKWMRFRKNGASATLGNVHHYFLVHGVFSYWGPVLGYVDQSRGLGMLTTSGSGGGVLACTRNGNQPIMFQQRGDLDWIHYIARFFQDGRLLDPYSSTPRYGFQLLECDLLSAPGAYQSFFYNYFETYKNDIPGGDFLCEAIIFQDRLTEEERLAVERYLMAKWKLPQTVVTGPDKNTSITVSEPRGTGTVRTAPGATAEVTVAAGEESVPLAFDGTGDVVKKGGGTLVLGASVASAAGTARFTLEDGDVVLRGGALPPVTLGAGERWSAAELNTAARPDNHTDLTDVKIAYDLTSGVRVARSVIGGTSTAKTGDAELRVGEVAANVRRLAVEAGTLTFTARETPLSEPTALADDAEVYIPNHSFEQPFSIVANNRNYRLGDYANGWHNTGGGAGMQFVTLYPRITTWTSYAFPDGTNALMLVQAGQATTDVTVPHAGEYELSFWATSRYGIPPGSALSSDTQGTGIRRSVVNILFAGRIVGRVQVNKGEFYRFRHRFTVTAEEAGVSKLLGFGSKRVQTDNCIIIDDVHLRAVATPDRTDTVKVPGGDFELNDVVGATSATPGVPTCFSREIGMEEGWTFSLDEYALTQNPTNGYVTVATPSTLTYHSGYYRTPFFPFADPGCGSGMLAFLGACGIAQSDTFTLPAGRWLLRARMAYFPMYASIPDNGEKSFAATPNIRAKLLRGDNTVQDLDIGHTPQTLATVSIRHVPDTILWTNVVEVAADEQVRLSLSPDTACGVTLDDLEFMPAEAALPERNLVPNPCFERNGAAWGTHVVPSPVTYSTLLPNRNFAYATDTWAFGYAGFFGDYCARLHNNGGVNVQVGFPAPGLYRLTMHVRARADETGTHNPVRAYVLLSDGSTNEICRIKVPTGQNFVEYSYLFRMPEAGSHKLYIEGMGVPSGVIDKNGKDTANLTTLLDGVSVVKVNEAAQTMPSLPKNLRINVAEGSRLVLDYPGTNKVASVRFGGEAAIGRIVDATSHPDYVTGIGALEIVPRNMTISFR